MQQGALVPARNFAHPRRTVDGAGRPLLVWAAWARRQRLAPSPEEVGCILIQVLEGLCRLGTPVPAEWIWLSPTGDIGVVYPAFPAGSCHGSTDRCLHSLGIFACELLAGEAIPASSHPTLSLGYARQRVECRRTTWDPALGYVLERMLGLTPFGYPDLHAALMDMNDLCLPQAPKSLRQGFGLRTLQQNLEPGTPQSLLLRKASLAIGGVLGAVAVVILAFFAGRGLQGQPTRLVIDQETLKQLQAALAPPREAAPLQKPPAQPSQDLVPINALASQPRKAAPQPPPRNLNLGDLGEPVFVEGPAPDPFSSTSSVRRVEGADFVAVIPTRKRAN